MLNNYTLPCINVYILLQLKMLSKLFTIAAAIAACADATTYREMKTLKNDPADSWLVYAAAKPTNNQRVVSVNATWVVPAMPKSPQNGNSGLL